MAKQEHVDLLCAGAGEWNRRRGETMDLSHVEIRSASLAGVNFAATNFDGTRLVDVNLAGCSMTKARFNGVSATLVDLRGADMHGAELKGTDLSKCCMDAVRLTGVESYLWKVRHTSFVGAVIQPEKLHHAHFYNCNFSGCDFGGADFQYVDIKRGEVSTELERDLGERGVHFALPRMPNVKDWEDWDKLSLPVNASEYGVIIHNYEAYWISEKRWDVFISYQRAQRELAESLARELGTRGLRVWFDAAALAAGDSLRQSIDMGLNACPFGVAVVSEDYFGRKWTEYEWERLLLKRMVVVLHEIKPDRVIAMYPQLGDKIMLTSDLGIKSLAQMISETIRRPPRKLVTEWGQ